jgi:hypothetical protein
MAVRLPVYRYALADRRSPFQREAAFSVRQRCRYERVNVPAMPGAGASLSV